MRLQVNIDVYATPTDNGLVIELSGAGDNEVAPEEINLTDELDRLLEGATYFCGIHKEDLEYVDKAIKALEKQIAKARKNFNKRAKKLEVIE